MEPVGLIWICLRNHIVVWSRQVAPSCAAATTGKLSHQRRNAVIQRIDAERPTRKIWLARILESVRVLVVILANSDRACRRGSRSRAALARVIIRYLIATPIEYGRAQVAF